MKNELKIYKITFVGYGGKEESVYMCAHSFEYAIRCFEECSEDEILYVTEAYVADGFILD